MSGAGPVWDSTPGTAGRDAWREALIRATGAYAQDRLSAGELVACFRQAAQTRPDLPERYRAVLERLLQPMEASALFSEESCAFSRTDLANSLNQWVTATEALDRP